MFFSLSKTFDDAIKPLIFLNCHSGIFITCCQPNQSTSAYFCMQLYTIIVNVVNWITMYIALSVTARAPNFRDASPTAIMMYKILICTNCCFTVIGPCAVWFQKKGLKNCLRQMQILDDTFQTVLGARNEYRKDCTRLTCQVTAVLLVMTAVSSYDSTWSLEYSRSLWISFCITMTLHHPILVMLVLDINFCVFVRYLEKKFRDLNDALLRLAETPNYIFHPGKKPSKIFQNAQRQMTERNTVENTEAEELLQENRYLLREIQKSHLELCKLTRQVNSIFGKQNLMSSGISFGMITGLLYTIYSAFGWERVTSSALKEIIPSAMWAAIYTFKIFVVNHSCWSVTCEAQRTKEVIYEFLKIKSADELQKDQIQLFALQMFQNPIRFDACGFFTLDYTFVQGIIGSITTYLIILIQMSHLSEQPIALNPCKNGTEI